MKNKITEICYYVEGNNEVPLMSIMSVEGEVTESKTQPNTSELKNWLNAIGSQSPTILTNVSNSTSVKQILTFSPKVAKGLEQGIYNNKNAQGFLTGVARNSDGNIVGHGMLKTARQVNPATVATLGFQILTIVASQQHLADIDKKLGEINNSVSKINDFLLNQQKAKIKTSVEYLNKLSVILQKGGLAENEITTYHNKLESIEIQCLDLKNHVFLELEKNIKHIMNMSFQISGGTWFDGHLEELDKNVRHSISEVEETFKTYQTILAIRLYNCQIASILPINQDGIQFVLDTLDRNFKDINNMKSVFYANTHKKIENFSASRATPATNQSYRDKLKNYLSHSIHNISEKSKKIQQTLTHISETKQQIDKQSNAKYLATFNEKNEITDLKLLS